jgi:pseudouridylate synthase
VQDALADGRAVVALESTTITHGIPYPHNLEMARGVEDLVRLNGAVPATIALVDGQMVAGLGEAELERLARDGAGADKASRRDLAALLVKGGMAGTTATTTMMIAAMVGIRVFATGGIGGVNRGGETSMDISADIDELGRTSVAVVSSGIKAMFDIPRTLQVLETRGVPVIGWQTDEFPAFYTRKSGQRVDHRFDSANELAQMLKLQLDLGMGGVLIANPVPEEYEMDAKLVETLVVAALNQAEKRSVRGNDITPFLTRTINELSGGSSLKTNIALVRHNAEMAAEIAVALARLG